MVRTRWKWPISLLRFLAALVVVVPAASAVVVGGATAAAAAGGVAVSVGYADTLRADPQFFPTPWEGDPGVVFAGCAPRSACLYEGGAVKIDNDTGAAVTIDSVVIRYDTCVYDIWPRGIVIPAGQRLIVTQTVSGATDGCQPQLGVMDGSDIGPGGAPWSRSCVNSNYLPTVELRIDGQLTTFSDSAQVLTTGGVDYAYCGNDTHDANESLQWSPIGHLDLCPTSQLALAPAQQLRGLGAQASLTATFTNSCGDPLPGATVDFTAAPGVNAGWLGSAVTDAQGVATLDYTSATAGTDTVRASITNAVGVIDSNQVEVTWNDPPQVSAPATATGPEGSSIELAGSVSDPDGPGLTQHWSYTTGADVDPGTTCAFGDPTAPATTITCTDDGTITATLTAEDGVNAAVSASVRVAVTNVAPRVGVSAPEDGALYRAGATVTVTAPFTDSGVHDTHQCAVDWDDGQPPATATVTETDGAGSCVASRTIEAAGVYSALVTVTDDDGAAATAPVTIVVYDPEAGFVTGGATFTSPAGAYTPRPELTGPVHVGFVSRYQRGAQVPRGQTEFQFQLAGVNFHSDAYRWLVVSGGRAQFTGTGSLDGVPGYTFVLTAADGDLPGGDGQDRLRMRITGPDGVVYDNAPGASGDIDAADPQPLRSGSVVIHTR